MSFTDFKKATGQLERRRRGGIRGAFGIKKTYVNEDARSAVAGEKSDYRVTTDINVAFERYEENPSTAAMIALYDRITYWQTLHHGKQEEAQLRFVLEAVKEQIQADIQAETDKQGGSAAGMPASSLLGKGDKTGTKPQKMEPFLREVGVPQGYYDEHLAGHPEFIGALQAFYDALKDGHPYNASRAYRKVSHIEGMYLIKPLFLSHFPNQANLGGVVGTRTTSPKPGLGITPEEMEAIKIYSGSAYQSMNSTLRSGDMRSPKGPGIGKSRMSEDAAKQDAAAIRRRSLMELAVSGMNKLPKFQGIAFRVSINVPPGYFSAVRPGGMMADLAFSSASPSMSGVGSFASTQFGTKSIYYIIHTKTAVNIVGFALGPNEAEVLFRPGTRFYVKSVWQHREGKVPREAPTQAQMILHAMGPFKDSQGLTQAEWTERQRRAKIFAGDDEQKKAELEAQKFGDDGLSPVKVVELVEV